MYQAGIKNITLYENKGITFRHWDLLDISEITDLQSLGSVISIENIQRPKFNVDSKLLKSGKLGHEYSIDFFFLGMTVDNINTIKAIIESIYGWCFLVEFYDGTFKFYNTPVFCRENKIKPHDEMSFNLTLNSSVPTLKTFLKYTAGVSGIPVYRWDTTLLSFDDSIYSFDYEL